MPSTPSIGRAAQAVRPLAAARAVAGIEWVVDATGCCAAQLADELVIRNLLARATRELKLNVLQESVHKFPAPGGLTALLLLSESHLACHTYPESGVATFNLYCCRLRPEWPWAERLAESLGAQEVTVRRFDRG